MLDGILGRGFSAKCKSLIKLTRSRIDVIRRKRTATQKFLKKDIADLLSNGLDVNAYGRAEGLLIELRLSSCYDFVDQCCEFLLKHLSAMQKQSDCPEDCREAVSSLMFAAARFSDLPELRDLRQTFQERYGDSLEYCLNKEFAEKLSAKPCTMEKKVELMQDIAVEFSIKWNARNFEQRMSKASATEQAQSKNGGFLYAVDDKYKVSNGKETSYRGEKTDPSLQDAASNGHKFHKNIEANGWKRNELEIHNDQRQVVSNVRRVHSEKEVLITRKEMDFTSDLRVRESPSLKLVGSSGSSHRNFDDYGGGGVKPDKLKEKHVVENASSASVKRDEARFLAMKPPKSEVQATPFDKLKEKHVVEDTPPASVPRDEARFLAMKPPKIEVQATTPFDSSNAKFKVEEDNRRKPCNYAIPPPYVKPNVRKEAVQDVADPTLDKVSENVEKMENLPRPRSHRRRHSRPRSNHDDDDHHHHEEDERKRTSRRREDPRKGLQILFDDDRRHKDEEERIIDKLLIHYSKKPSFDEEEARSRRKSRSRRVNGEPERRGSRLKEEVFEGLPPPPPRRVNAGSREPERRGNRPKEEEFEVLPAPPRSISLPREQPSAPPEPVKVYARAASFQPDRSDEARHVHPKLPDYDDLAARFAALKGR